MKKMFKWAAVAVILGMAALQLTNPRLTNPPVLPGHDVMATNPPPPEIAAILKSSCYNCHSFETQWPWYSNIAPFSWRIAFHVENGRAALNFSKWPHDNPLWVRKRWRHIADAVEEGEMPLPSYVLIHPAARLTDQDRARLVQWARQAAR
jgi:Haem-binding domain